MKKDVIVNLVSLVNINNALQFFANDNSVNCSTNNTLNQNCPSDSNDISFTTALYYAELAIVGLGFVMSILGSRSQNTRWGRIATRCGFSLCGSGGGGLVGTALGEPSHIPLPLTSAMGSVAGVFFGNWAYKKLCSAAGVMPAGPIGAAPPPAAVPVPGCIIS